MCLWVQPASVLEPDPVTNSIVNMVKLCSLKHFGKLIILLLVTGKQLIQEKNLDKSIIPMVCNEKAAVIFLRKDYTTAPGD